jgi:hypothetical protein
MVLIFAIGLVLIESNPAGNELCRNGLFQTFRIFPLFLLAIFFMAYRQILKNIEKAEHNSEVGMKIYML